MARRLLGWFLIVLFGVCLAAALCRKIPLYLSLPCLGLALGGSLVFGREQLREVMSKRFAVNAAVLLVSLVFSGVVAELGARWLLPEDTIPCDFSQHHPKYFFLPKPGGHWDAMIPVTKTENCKVPHDVSPQGLRDRVYGPKAPDEYRILMLGDSFTQGHAVLSEDSIPKQLEKLLAAEDLPKRISVINAGVGGAGPFQELGMLKEFGLALEPDLVVLQLYPENDIDDSLSTVGKFMQAYNEDFRSYLRDWQHQGLFPFRAERWVNGHSRLYREVKRISRVNDPIVKVLANLRLCQPLRMPPLPPCAERSHLLEVNLKDWYPELEEGMALLEKYVLELRAECERNGLDLIAYVLPTFSELRNYRQNKNWVALYEEGVEYERYKALGKVESFLQREQIPTFSVVSALEAAPRARDIIYLLDGHLNAKGNGIVAGEIRDYLLEAYFPERLEGGAGSE